MEALILSCSTGGGHNSAGKAIAKALESRGWKTVFLDPYSLRSQKMADRVGNAYVSMVRFSPALFGGVYEIGRMYAQAEKAFHLPDPVLMVQKKTALVLYDYLSREHFDLVLCTHPYPGLMLTWLKQHHYEVPPCMMIATDYTCIPFEEDVQTDWMIIPHPDLIEEFHSQGFPYEKILPLGIPVDPKFGVLSSKKRACAALGLDASRTYLLIGAGSMGTSGILPVIQSIRPMLDQKPELSLLVLCGSNDAIRKKVEKMNHAQIQAIPFTTRVYEYLHASSLFITKPGGLSITEAAACKTPLLLTQAIPGCETANEKFFLEHGLADLVKDPKDIPAAIELELYTLDHSLHQSDDFFRMNTDRLADWCECAAGLNSKYNERKWNEIPQTGPKR